MVFYYFDIPTSVPFVILNDVLGENPFQYQEELLLPPFLSFSKFKLDLTQKEWEYRDIDNAHPKAKYLLKITNYMSKLKGYDILNKEYDLSNISEDTKYIISILERLVDGYGIQKHEIIKYYNCKAKIQGLVQEMFLNIYRSFYEK